MSETRDYTLLVWRQKDNASKGELVRYQVTGVSPDASFLEMLDVVNEGLLKKGEAPIAFDHDCREGICGMCGFMINGRAHGPDKGGTVCQLHMRRFPTGTTLVVEPWRARAFPVLRDLVVDRSSFDRIQQAGGYVSANTGAAPEANSIPVPKPDAEASMDAAACIGCGACVAACPNASAMLFLAAKVSHLALLPQGRPERERRALAMTERMKDEGFGACSNEKECEAVCPKEIEFSNIARLNREYLRAAVVSEE